MPAEQIRVSCGCPAETVRPRHADTEAHIRRLAALMQVSDSALPVGGFAFSGGVEAASATRIVTDAESLGAFIRSQLRQSATSDAAALAHAARACLGKHASSRLSGQIDDMDDVCAIDRSVMTRKPSPEARLMTVRTGKKLTELCARLYPSALSSAWANAVHEGRSIGTWPVALAVYGVVSGLVSCAADDALTGRKGRAMLEDILAVFFYIQTAGALNAALRSMRITHLDTQELLTKISNDFPELCRRAASLPLADRTSFSPMTDILSACHERSLVRLFMS